MLDGPLLLHFQKGKVSKIPLKTFFIRAISTLIRALQSPTKVPATYNYYAGVYVFLSVFEGNKHSESSPLAHAMPQA